MYSYLIMDWGLLPVSLFTQKHNQSQQVLPVLFANSKLAVFTIPANALTCDPCQPTKFKGYLRVFIYIYQCMVPNLLFSCIKTI